MKRKWQLAACAAAVVLVLLGVVALCGGLGPGRSEVTVKREDGLFSLGMTMMNEAQSATFALSAGDAIDVSLVRMGGEVSIRIARDGDAPVYEGRNPELGSFRVSIPSDGDYVITVTGQRAEGSVSFRAVRAEE